MTGDDEKMKSDSVKNRIRILMTSDVHGKVFPHSYSDGSPKNYGFGRLAGTIEKLRDENTILIDNGDTLEGSPLQLFHMMSDLREREPSPVSRIMKAMKYDFINLGNHDFNFGHNVLFRHIEETGAKCITGNVLYNDNLLASLNHDNKGNSNQGNSNESFRQKSYEIIEVAGKRIALFGLLTHFVTRWESEENLRGFKFENALESAKRIVSEIKSNENVDYIVSVYHGGFEKDIESDEPIGMDTGENQGYRIMTEIPEIDVFLTGHQHRLMVGIKDGRAYVQPGAGGEYLACVDIYPEGNTLEEESFDEETYGKSLIETRLIKVETEANNDLLSIVSDEEANCQTWLDQVIGETKIDLCVHDEFRDRLNKTQLITYVNNIQLKRTGADVSAAALFQGATGIGPGITIRQIVSTYVFPDNITVKKINGKILREYLEKDMEFWAVDGDSQIIVNPAYEIPNPQYFNYDLLDGVEYTAKISNPVGERIVSLTKDGIPITDDMEFTIAINHYRAAGGGDFFMLSEAETVWEDSVTMIDILVNEIKENTIIDFKPVNNINVLV